MKITQTTVVLFSAVLLAACNRETSNQGGTSQDAVSASRQDNSPAPAPADRTTVTPPPPASPPPAPSSETPARPDTTAPQASTQDNTAKPADNTGRTFAIGLTLPSLRVIRANRRRISR